MTERLNWHKSSYSGGNAGACVEVAEWHKSSYSKASGECVEAAEWYKSSYSGASGGDCVEVADTPRLVHVRDTQNRRAGHLSFPASSWHAFISSLKSGAFAE
ncbi:MAG: DUF397 domain-containing protein [Nocardiopsaceae bacterium]|nr:DUF397 domain-containing protein [Nocardiopsaceae bacterium]